MHLRRQRLHVKPTLVWQASGEEESYTRLYDKQGRLITDANRYKMHGLQGMIQNGHMERKVGQDFLYAIIRQSDLSDLRRYCRRNDIAIEYVKGKDYSAGIDYPDCLAIRILSTRQQWRLVDSGMIVTFWHNLPKAGMRS